MKKQCNRQEALESNKDLINAKIACNFVRIFDTRVKSMFVRFFSLTYTVRISDLFSILESQNQIIFFLLASKFELNNYRK